MTTKGSTINDRGGRENREKFFFECPSPGKKIQEAFLEKFFKKASARKKKYASDILSAPPRSLMVEP